MAKKKDIVHNDLNLDLECGLVKSTKHVHEFGYVGNFALEGLPKEQNRPIRWQEAPRRPRFLDK